MAIAYNRRRTVHERRAVNVGPVERFFSVLLGGVMAYKGIREGGVRGFVQAAGGGYLLYRGESGHCKVYETLGVDSAGWRGVSIKESITIFRPVDEVYRYWRRLENLPSIMEHLESVKVLDDGRSHWVARTPGGIRVEWDSEITAERENELITWRSISGASDIDNEGAVRFTPAPGGRGTVLKVHLIYHPPAGAFGAAVARFLNYLATGEIHEELKRFKYMMETGGQPRISAA